MADPTDGPEIIQNKPLPPTYHGLLNLIYQIGISYRGAVSCRAGMKTIVLYFTDTNGRKGQFHISDNDAGRITEFVHLLVVDGYTLEPPHVEYAHFVSIERSVVVLTEKIIRDIEAKIREVKERKRHVWGEILKWGLGYVIAATLTILATIPIECIKDSRKAQSQAPFIVPTSSPNKLTTQP